MSFIKFLNNICLRMDNGDNGQDVNTISPIMTLPEEAMREIFNYLLFPTLYFSLRMVCKHIQTYVDHYLKIRGTSFFASCHLTCRKCLEREVIEITEMPRIGFNLLRSPASTIPWITSKLRNYEIIDDYRDRDRLLEMMFHAEKYPTGVCQLYMSEKSSTFRYDLESKMWERVLENCTPLKWLDHQETSHDFIQMVVSKIIPQHFERRSCQYFQSYPFALVIIINIGRNSKHSLQLFSYLLFSQGGRLTL